jgi:Domain of unknown function (DUF4258)
MDLADITKALRAGRVRITDHADEEAEADRLTFDEIYFSVFRGEVIETYEKDAPYPSCLIFGQTFGGEPIHSVWAYDAESQWAVLVTVYRPDPTRWVNWRERRKPR